MRYDTNHDYVRDVMFTQAGGIGGIAKLVRALRKLEAPVIVVADFDLINNQATFRDIFAALGGDMLAIQSSYDAVRQDIDKMGRASVANIKKNIRELLDKVQDSEEALPPHVVRKIQSETKPHIGWRNAKQHGIEVLDHGPARKAGEHLLSSLATTGLFLVRKGELESFDPVVEVEKNKWVNRVLEKFRGRFSTAEELKEAREFVAKMLASGSAGTPS